jgi:hypothetical protein
MTNNILYNAEAITLNSTISGTTPNIKTQLALKCGLGDFSTRLTFTGDSTFNRLACYGQIESKGIDVSKIVTGNSPVGIVALKANINGLANQNRITKAAFDGKVNRIDFNQYTYKDIDIDAQLDNNC